ncbi:MAG: Na+/H+ antiporter subunit E [Lautropia sp.]
MMRTLLPSPLLSLALLLSWPVLNQSWTLGQWLLGGLLAIAIPYASRGLRDSRPTLHRPATILRLVAVFLWDIVVANVEVARRILGPEARIHPRFVWVPLDLKDPHGIVTLACIISMTPGSLSADLAEDRRHLLVHLLSETDEAAAIAHIKARYEAPLIAIFEGRDP